jgi:Ca-activated chloride channel homolog
MAPDDNVGRGRSYPSEAGGNSTGVPDRRPAGRLLRVGVLLGVGVLGVLATALPQLATTWPANASQWVLLAVGGLANAILVALGLDRLLVATPKGWDWLSRNWWKHLPVLVVPAVVLGLLVGTGLAVTNVWFRVDRLINGCPVPTELRVLTTPEGRDPTRELADAYEQATATRDHGCRTVNVHVYATDTASARSALAGEWSIDALRDVGPRPDVWLPDSTLQVEELLTLAKGITVPIVERRTVAWSPIVVGIPRSVADPNERHGIPWSRLLDRSARLKGGLVRPDPAISPAGQIATTAIYGDATVNASRRDIEQNIERSLDGGGYPLDDASAVLCRHRMRAERDSADAPMVAVIASEQALVRFNRGATLGGACAIPQDRAADILLAFYPSETPALDHPFVRFDWDGRPLPQTAAATDLGQWLATDDGKRALISVGLRPPGGYTVSEPLSNDNGVLPGAVFDRLAPEVGKVTTATGEYTKARRPGRVLLALDASGSMQQPTRSGDTRLSAAKKGIRSALNLMGNRDELGLWAFPPGGREVAPIGGVSRRQATEASLDGIQARGNTPLYDTIVAGVSKVGAPTPGDPIRALVVLTDGEDTDSQRTAEQMLSAVEDQKVRVFVVAVGEANCSSEAIAKATSLTGGGCYQASFETVDKSLAQLFSMLWEGTDHAG